MARGGLHHIRVWQGKEFTMLWKVIICWCAKESSRQLAENAYSRLYPQSSELVGVSFACSSSTPFPVLLCVAEYCSYPHSAASCDIWQFQKKKAWLFVPLSVSRTSLTMAVLFLRFQLLQVPSSHLMTLASGLVTNSTTCVPSIPGLAMASCWR